MAFKIRSCSRLEAWVPSSPSLAATSLSSSIEPAILRHVLCFNTGLLSRYSRKWVSSCPSMSQNLRLSPSRPHGCTESGWLRSSSCLCCLYDSLSMAWTASEEPKDQMMRALSKVSYVNFSILYGRLGVFISLRTRCSGLMLLKLPPPWRGFLAFHSDGHWAAWVCTASSRAR